MSRESVKAIAGTDRISWAGWLTTGCISGACTVVDDKKIDGHRSYHGRFTAAGTTSPRWPSTDDSVIYFVAVGNRFRCPPILARLHPPDGYTSNCLQWVSIPPIATSFGESSCGVPGRTIATMGANCTPQYGGKSSVQTSIGRQYSPKDANIIFEFWRTWRC